MRIGPSKDKDYHEEKYTLYDWAMEGNRGIIGHEHPDQLPDEMIEFCLEQYKRFGIQEANKWEDVVRAGAWASFLYVDVDYPYALMETSSIQMSNIQYLYGIDIVDPKIQGWAEEADVDKLEIFEPSPGRDRAFFDAAYLNPGLEHLPGYPDGRRIQEIIYDYDMYHYVPDEVVKDLAARTGGVDSDSFKAYFELAAWAAFIWMVGPLGSRWRVEQHDAFWLCETQGLAVLYEMCFLANTHYKILKRAPKTCCVCGLDSYCVDVVFLEGAHRYICEKHFNPEVTHGRANCGSRFCKYVECFNHPLYGATGGLNQVLRSGGMLTQRLQSNQMLVAPDRKLIV